VRPDVVDDEDVGVVEPGGRFRLLLESREAVGVRRKLRVDHFQGDVPLEPRVPRPVDLAHAAAPRSATIS